jgi:hypothetical protein
MTFKFIPRMQNPVCAINECKQTLQWSTHMFRSDLYWFIFVSSLTVARSKAWTVFARLNTGIVGSNPTRDMNVCVRLLCVCVVLCAGSGLATGWSPVQRVLLTVYRIKKQKSGKGPQANQKNTFGTSPDSHIFMQWKSFPLFSTIIITGYACPLLLHAM